MKGRDRFSSTEATRIRELLREVRRAEPGSAQKLLRDQLRAIGFYISDWGGGPEGFTASEFDELVALGQIKIGRETAVTDVNHRSLRHSAGQAGARTDARPGDLPDLQAGPEEGAPLPVSALGERARTALRGPALTIEEALGGAVPNRPGLYAIYGGPASWQTLGLGTPPDGRPLYVGKAEASLVSRDLRTHFATGKTGRSSPRRSFAALLVDELQLVPMPRRPESPEAGKWSHYALEEPGDTRLTEWMQARLTLACWASPPGASLGTIEAAVMREWLPPLNLIGITTPWTIAIREARAVLADGAKDWARAQGLSVE